MNIVGCWGLQFRMVFYSQVPKRAALYKLASKFKLNFRRVDVWVIKNRLGRELCPFPSFRRRMKLGAAEVLKKVNEVASHLQDVPVWIIWSANSSAHDEMWGLESLELCDMTKAAALLESEEQIKPLEKAWRVQHDYNDGSFWNCRADEKWRRGFKLRLSGQDYVCPWN